MKSLKFLLGLMVLMPLASYAKPVVFIDKFVPNGGCQTTEANVQNLNDRIVGAVTSSRKYEVVERENLAKIQQELKLVDAGLTEGAAPESNALKAAGYCIYGKILQFRNFSREATAGDLKIRNVIGTVELQIRIVNIANSRVLAAKTVKVEKSRSQTNATASSQDIELEVMTEATSEAVRLVVEKLNDVAYPVYVLSANSRFVIGNVTEDLVRVGDVWEVFVLGDELKDPQSGEVLGFDEDLIASVRVSRPGPKTTKFEYGKVEGDAEVAKKSILQAKEDGEKMIMRKVQQAPVKPIKRMSKPSLRDM